MTKRHLKTPEKIIKALKEGKEVKGDCGETYKMFDGFIVEASEGHTCINPSIVLHEEYNYIEESVPLEIEEGKFYKTRAGKKAVCVFVAENGNRKMAIFGENRGAIYWAPPRGRLYVEEECDEDIISEWKED